MRERDDEEKIEKRTETVVEPEITKQRPSQKDKWSIEKPEPSEKFKYLPKEENKQ
jgi:hypothetical protein